LAQSAGISLGISPESAHDIVCTRSLLEFLGTETDIKDALGKCGEGEPDSSEISDYVLHCVANDVPDSATAMMPRN